MALFTGCTQPSEEEQAQVDVLEEQAADLGQTGNPFEDATDEQEDCVDDELPDFDGVGALTDSSSGGVQARVDLTNALIDCFPELTGNDLYVAQTTATFNAALGGNADVSNVEGGCLLAHVLDNAEDPGRALADGTDQADTLVFLAGVEACFDENSLSIVRGEPGAGPQNVGDDELLDALAADCTELDDRACDLLFLRSNVDTEYSRVGATCAGRSDSDDYCTVGLMLDEAGQAAEGSLAVGLMKSLCRDGEMTSCDLMYQVAPLGSADEQFGFTCGERIAIGALPNCRTRFGRIADS